MNLNKRISVWFATVICLVTVLCIPKLTVQAETTKDTLDDVNAGVAFLLDPSALDTEQTKDIKANLASKADENKEVQEEEPEEESTLFMADVQKSMNVREEPDENSSKVGVLYKDCGGEILEKGDGWTKIKSGKLIGWAKNDYLVFDDEAKAMAADVGYPLVIITADALRVRKEPNQEAGIWGLVAKNDQLEVVDKVDGWVKINYEGEDGFISMEFVEETYHIDEGETIEQIKEREEEERKAKLREKQAAVEASTDDVKLLAALIQCETGYVSQEGMLAVGAVVMNRVRSGAYPGTIHGVIFASGQFPPALNGKVANVYANGPHQNCIAAAQRAINGETNVGTATHFKRAGAHEGLIIAGQVFW